MKNLESMTKDEQLQQDLTNFMFLRDAAGNLDAIACLSLWFGKSHDTDNEIRKRYGELVKQTIELNRIYHCDPKDIRKMLPQSILMCA